MLLEDFMPESDVRASYATRIAASPEWVYACLWTADFDHWGLTRAIYALRALPTIAAAPRETWRRVRVELRPHRVTLDAMLAEGFTLLGERPGEELVLGTVGRFWRARGELCPTSPARFREPPRPGRRRRDGTSRWADGQAAAPNSGPRPTSCARMWRPGGASARIGC